MYKTLINKEVCRKHPRGGSLELLAANSLPTPTLPWPEPSPSVFVTTPPQGWATPFAGSRTTWHHSCSAPVNQLPMGSPPSALSAHPLSSLTFKLHNRNQQTPPPGHRAAPTADLWKLPGKGLSCPPPAWSPAFCKQAHRLQPSPEAWGMHVTKPAPLLACPHGLPAFLSLGSRPRPPWGYSSVPCVPSQPWNVGHPTALRLHPISLHQHLFGDFTVQFSCSVVSDSFWPHE